MADNFKYAQLQPFYLSGSGAITGDTSVILKSMLDIDGNAITMSSAFGTLGFGTLEPGNGTNEEQISFTGLTNNTNGTTTLTGVKSVTMLYPYTATSGLLKTHAGSTTFIISNTSGYYDTFTNKNDDEDILGLWNFAQTPTGINPGAVPDSSTTVKGIGKVSVAPVSPTSPIFVGDNDSRVSNLVSSGHTGLTAGTSGGILGFTGSNTIASSVELTASALILGGGAGATPTPMASLGTTTTVLHGNVAGAPTFGSVSLTTDVSGVLPVANGGSGVTNILNNVPNTVVTGDTFYTYTVPFLGVDTDATNNLVGWKCTAIGDAYTLGQGGATGYGYILSAGGNSSIISDLPGITFNQNYRAGDSKTIYIKMRLALSTTSNIKSWGIVDAAATSYAAQTSTSRCIRFVENAGTLYSSNADGTTATNTDVSSGITRTNMNTYEIVFIPGTSATFYINGTVVATQTTNLPTAGTDLSFAIGLSTDTQGIMISPMVISLQK